MKKYLCLLAVLCLLLAGCSQQSDKFAHGETGNYYNEFTGDGSVAGTYTVTAEAHVEDVLTLLYFDAAAETTLGFELKLASCDGDVMLYQVNEDGAEYSLAGTNDKKGIDKPLTFKSAITVPTGKSHLEWRSENGAVLQFELQVTGLEDVEVSMKNFEELPEIEELPEVKPEEKTQTDNSIKM